MKKNDSPSADGIAVNRRGLRRRMSKKVAFFYSPFRAVARG
jgi:hypothetical protein